MISITFETSFPLVDGFLHLKFDETFFESKLLVLNKFVNKYQTDLISNLNKLSGLNFKNNSYSFWLILGTYPSISRPNLLNVNQQNNKIFFDFFRLLTHNIFFENNFYDLFLSKNSINEIRLEATVHIVAEELMKRFFDDAVVEKLISDLRSDLFSKYIWDEVDVLRNKQLCFPLKKTFFKQLD
ncbi:MAG: hypothetical protein ACQESC_01025 [Nanobdellota archaeon]